MRNSEVGLFDTFNARNLSFEEVAVTFIPNSQFDQLIENNHSLLMGPRGSGKTTLLKMLSPASLESWSDNKSELYKKTIPFYGVYIPTDTQFKKQLDFLKEKVPDNAYKIIANTILNTNILVHLFRTFIFIANKIEPENIELEIEFTSNLVDVWRIERPISPTLSSIEHALLKRVVDINNIVNKIMYGEEIIPLSEYPSYFLDGFLSLCDYACSLFETIYLESKPVKWALCFDELELAPEWLESLLLGYIRSTSQRFLFKLTTSPIIPVSRLITEMKATSIATSINDFRIVRTWPDGNSDIKSWNKFCQELVESRFSRKFKTDVSANYLFGSQHYERVAKALFTIDKSSENENIYSKGGFRWKLLRYYATLDPSFKELLERKNIDPINPIPADASQKDTFFRKVMPIVFFRFNLKKESGLRSRKNAPLYYGVPYIYEICDGNPRKLIGLIDELVSRVTSDERNLLKPLPILDQSSTIRSVSERYIKLIATHPDANIGIGKNSVNVKELLDKIGNYFFEKIIEGPFPLDPVGTFVIDDVQTSYIQLLEFALSHGAIVYLNPDEGVLNDGIIGKRFRLSYLLFPSYRLPKREYGSVRLSIILDSQKNNIADIGAGTQLNLF